MGRLNQSDVLEANVLGQNTLTDRAWCFCVAAFSEQGTLIEHERPFSTRSDYENLPVQK